MTKQVIRGKHTRNKVLLVFWDSDWLHTVDNTHLFIYPPESLR